MNRHLEADWAILKYTNYPYYIRMANVTWLGNHLASKMLRRLHETERYANLGESPEIPDRQLRKAMERGCSLISRKACTYAQYKYGAMAHLDWLEKESILLSERKIGYYFPGVTGHDRIILSDRALYCRDYCAKIVRFLSDILEVEMFLRDHSNRENTSLFIRMTTELSEEANAEIDTYDNATDLRMRHKDLLIHGTPLFNWMYSDYEHDVAVIW
jgi:hypothetical protein